MKSHWEILEDAILKELEILKIQRETLVQHGLKDAHSATAINIRIEAFETVGAWMRQIKQLNEIV